MTGCGDEPPPPPKPIVQAPPPPPPPPKVTSIAELMAKLNIDPRVSWPEERAPSSILDADRAAILTFFDAFARGDSSRLQPMLASTDQYELDNLVKSGAWDSTTKKITKVDVRAGRSPETPSRPCVLAVYRVGDNFEPQLWSYQISPTGAEFEAVATPPGIMNQLSGDDWIAAWFALLQKDQELASKPDENPNIPKTNVAAKDDGSDAPAGMAPAGPSAPAPSGQPGSPGKRTPGTPIKPARPGFSPGGSLSVPTW